MLLIMKILLGLHSLLLTNYIIIIVRTRTRTTTTTTKIP
jgi:hypothetical protein